MTVRREWRGKILKDIDLIGLWLYVRGVREREREEISRMSSQFLPWVGEWVVGYALVIENTERRRGLREGKE